nr:hypothetical protein [Betaproteobacteria bacterium]
MVVGLSGLMIGLVWLSVYCDCQTGLIVVLLYLAGNHGSGRQAGFWPASSIGPGSAAGSLQAIGWRQTGWSA